MTGIQLDPNDHWVEVDLAAQPQKWAAETVSQRWAAQRLEPDPDRVERITASVARIVDTLDTAALDAALLLYPTAAAPVVTVVGVRSFPTPTRLTLDELGDELSVPEEMLERPHDRSIVETPAGSAVRLVQRYREPLSPGVEEIRDHLAYGWLVADQAVIVSTTFLDLVASGKWITTVDELASSVRR